MTIEKRIEKARFFFKDETSLQIFDKLVEVNGNFRKGTYPDNLKFMNFRWNSKEDFVRLFSLLQDATCKKFIYGAGEGCKCVLYAECMRIIGLQGVAGIIDNNIKEERYGFPVYTFVEFVEKYKDEKVVVLNSVGMPIGEQIHKQCIEAG